MTEHATEPAERGRRTLDEMSDLVGDQGHTTNTRRWGRLVDQWLSDGQALAQSEDGRAAIAALMDDPRPTVRLWSAAAVLFWDADAARPILTEIRDSPIRYDLHSIMAKHTLLEFDAGRLARDAALPGSPGAATG
ncbi:MAG TPA: hypothetical protein VGK78_09565 [Nocardioides sp.]|uniref:hypothetical protein n=1 Tax=Nocardioides sp. TaxID=35761 RepID=UPI002F42A751